MTAAGLPTGAALFLFSRAVRRAEVAPAPPAGPRPPAVAVPAAAADGRA
ncbi:hypothetical protein [Streptomyces sp. HPF1205]|nr:hypothetical protein [Streptomyces sp. HPF1205]